MMYIDADEYIVPGVFPTIQGLIRTSPDDCDGIALFWKCFGSSFLEKNPHPGRCLQVYTQSETRFTPKLKTLARVQNISHFLSPHHYRFHNQNTRLWEPNTSRYITNKPNHDPNVLENIPHIYIAHYTDQSWECFCRRRSRPRDDTGQVRSFHFSVNPHHEGPVPFHARHNDYTEIGPQKTFYTMCMRIFSMR